MDENLGKNTRIASRTGQFLRVNDFLTLGISAADAIPGMLNILITPA